MREDKIINKPLDIPFKEFMPGQIIQSVQFNDDMKDIEDKVNEIVDKHNLGINKLHDHLDDLNNPHNVTPHQIGTYTNEEIDEFVDDIKNGNLFDKSISNRVLDDECVDTRVIQDGSVTVSKVDPELGSQLNLENNISITSRYTKEETDTIIRERVGDGTYSREEIDSKFEEYQAGTIVDGTISVDKLKYDVGTKLDISANPSITDRYTKAEVNNLIQKNGLPKDWGGLGEVEEVTPITDYGYLPIADVMTADEFIAPLTTVLDIDVKENVDARGEYSSVGDRLNKNDEKQEELSSKLELNMTKVNEQFNTIQNETLTIQNIKTEKFRDDITSTTYYVTEIKRQDVDGEILKPKLGIANDSFNTGNLETCREFAKRHNVSVVFNAGIFNTSSRLVSTTLIKDGIILCSEQPTGDANSILAWGDDGILNSFDRGTTPEYILSQGYKNALCGFVTLIKNGIQVASGSGTGNPRQAIGQRENGDIIFLTCEGRKTDEKGMDYDDLVRIFKQYNVKFAYNLDGGGSTSTYIKGVKINNNIDDNGFTDRKVANFIYFEKENKTNKSNDLCLIENVISHIDQRFKELLTGGAIKLSSSGNDIRGLRLYNGNTIMSALNFKTDMLSYYDMINGRTMFEVTTDGQIFTPKGKIGMYNQTPKQISISDLDSLKESGIYWVNGGTSIGGRNISYGVLNFYLGDNTRMQIAYPFDEIEGIKTRMRRSNGTGWFAWRDL